MGFQLESKFELKHYYKIRHQRFAGKDIVDILSFQTYPSR